MCWLGKWQKHVFRCNSFIFQYFWIVFFLLKYVLESATILIQKTSQVKFSFFFLNFSWNQLIHRDTACFSWTQLIHSDTAYFSWNHLIHSDIAYFSWNQLIHSDTAYFSWNHLIHSDTAYFSWNNLIHSNTYLDRRGKILPFQKYQFL